MRLLTALIGLAGLSYGLTIYPIPVEVNDRVGYLYIEGINGLTFKVSSEPFEEGMEDNLIVYPPQVRVRNGKAVVKVAFKDTDRKTEKAGRIVLTELRPQSDGMNISYSFSIPVFLKPGREVFKVSVVCDKDRMIIRNEGNVHVKITGLDGKDRLIYILPQKEKALEKAERIVSNRGVIEGCYPKSSFSK